MGSYLGAEYGSAYFTLSMFPLSGHYRYDGPKGVEESLKVEPGAIENLGLRLARLQAGDFLFDLKAARGNEAGRRWLAAVPVSPRSILAPEIAPEMAIFLHGVTPMRLLADGVEAKRAAGLN